MKKIYKLLLVGFASVSLTEVSAQNYTSPISAYQDITSNGQTFTFSFNTPPIGAHGTATLKVYYEGDFGDFYEWIDVEDEDGNNLGQAGPNSTGSDCAPEEFKEITFPAANINTWLGDNIVDFTLTTTYDVDPGNCTPSHIRVQLIYDYCAFGVPAQYANFNLTDASFCQYESAISLTGTPSGGTFSGVGVSNNSFSPAGLSPGVYAITYTATDNIGCTTTMTKNAKVLSSPVAQSTFACPGTPAILEVQGVNDFVWYTNTALTQVVDSGAVVNSAAITQTTSFYVAGIDSDDSFEVLSMDVTDSAVVDIDGLAGDDRGGIAITPNYVYIVGDDNTARFRADDLSNGVSLPIRDGIFSDLKTGQLWTLWNTVTSTTPDYDFSSNFTCNALRGLDSNLAFTNDIKFLSETLVLNYNVTNNAIFAGYGKLGLYSGSTQHFYVVDMDNGDVEDAGLNTNPQFWGGENWADWGVLEYDGTDYSVLFRDYNSDNVTRLVLPDGARTDANTLNDMNDFSTLTFSPWNNRWYFHYESGAQFGGINETLGYADGTFDAVTLSTGQPGCYTEVVATVNVIDLGPDVTICKNDIPVVLFAGLGYSSYTWNGVNNNYNAFPVTATGTYTVQAIDEFGCTITDAANVTVNECLSIDEAQLGLSVNVFPNPTDAIINLHIESVVSQDLKMELIDMAGKRLFNTQLNGVYGDFNQSFDMSSFAPGVYIINITGSQKGATQIRVVKQ